MDYLEVTKNEALLKYEENAFLLGNIFARPEEESPDESEEDSEEQDDDEGCLFNHMYRNKSENEEEIVNNLLKSREFAELDEPEERLMQQVKQSFEDYRRQKKLFAGHTNASEEFANATSELSHRLKTYKEGEEPLKEILHSANSLGLLTETVKRNQAVSGKLLGVEGINKETLQEAPFDECDNVVLLPI